jgi:LysM repeat protein
VSRASASADPPTRTPQGKRRHRYVVKRGDTLYGISRAYRVPLDKLMEWNGKAPDDPTIRPGEVLTIWK